MEFPSLGDHCQFDECKQIDFLPLQCKCGNVYCREHFNDHCLSGRCELAPPPRPANLKNDDQIYKCSGEGCRKGNLHEMKCTKCDKHYCIEHRFHPSCPEIDHETMAQKVEEYEAPRRQFAEANKDLQEKITENIRKALRSSTKMKTASKIHLMRIKQKALGVKSIPMANRVHFAIKKPANTLPKSAKIVKDVENIKKLESLRIEPDLKDTIPVFISKRMTLGRAIDTICDLCDIKNDNNRVGITKVRLFRQLDGYCISPLKMDIEIEELMNSEILLEGDRLVIDYIDTNLINKLDPDLGHLFLV